MIDENVEAAAERFERKLTGSEFTMSRSSNTEQDYTETKQPRDTQAVKEFVDTELFNNIMQQG
jgi:hypothetical protein